MSTGTHICVYFDDGGDEPACVCGERVLLVDEDGSEGFLVLLGAEASVDPDRAPVPFTVTTPAAERLAIPA